MVADVRARGKIAQFHHSGRRGICSRSFLSELDLLEETEREGHREIKIEKEKKKRENEGGMSMIRFAKHAVHCPASGDAYKAFN